MPYFTNQIIKNSGKETRYDIKDSPIKNHKYLFIGDSYMLGADRLGNSYPPFTDYLKDQLNLNMEVIKESGSGFARTGDSGHTFLQLLQTYSGIKSEISDIYVLGGYNDITFSLADINNAMTEFMSYAHSNFANASIYVGCLGHSQIGEDFEGLSKVINAYSLPGLLNYTYIQNSEYILHRPDWFSGDKIHPNKEGNIGIANYLSQFILGKNIDVFYQYPSSVTFPAHNGAQLEPFIMTESNGSCSVTMYNDATIDSSKLGNDFYWATTSVQLSEQLLSLVTGYNYTKVNTNAVYYTPEDSLWHSAPCELSLINGIWYMKLKALSSDNSSYFQGQINQIQIPAFSLTCPTALS